MPSAVAALPLPAKSLPPQSAGSSSLADAGGGSLASADFAALLLGQLTTEAAPIALPTDISATEALLAETAASPQDPALLLASMGMVLPSSLPATPQLTPNGNAALLDADAPPIALAADPSLPASTAKAENPGKALLAGTSGQASLATEIPLPTAQLQASAPAKLAGFEQKLADALPVAAEPQATPQQLANAAQLGNVPATPMRQATEQVRLDTPMRDQAWSAEFGQKVVWLATQDKQSAQITLNPPQLGPIEISLNVKNDQATAVFTSANAEVRDAIESALPRLREMLAGVGVELGQANVNAESFRQAYDGNSNGSSDGRGNKGREVNGLGDNVHQTRSGSAIGAGIKRGNGLVDTFA